MPDMAADDDGAAAGEEAFQLPAARGEVALVGMQADEQPARAGKLGPLEIVERQERDAGPSARSVTSAWTPLSLCSQSSRIASITA